jgi:hypothetical protein
MTRLLKRPLLSVRVHLNGDTGASPERSQKQFLRVRTRIIAAVLTVLVHLEGMRADEHVLDESRRSGLYTDISEPFPPSMCRLNVTEESLHARFQGAYTV